MSAVPGVFEPRLFAFRSRARTFVRGRADDPAWIRPSLIALLAGTALLYLVGLSASGWGNGFYAAAVQAATKSWKAFFFGSFDSSNFITVDKPPASLWMMDLSARVFGLSSWSILVPQALEGVAAVALLYAGVRRRFGASAGLIAGAVLALTPVAALMFRFDNPDALLTLLLVAAAYALTRSLERASGRWLALAGVLIGLAFLTKMLQALIVVPGFALVYLLAAPTLLRRRLLQLVAAGAAIVLSAGWWVAIVALWPASTRPYIGGSRHNSILELIFGYNGLGRITGDETGSVIGGGATPGAGAWGPTGVTRLFNAEMGTQISWLIPAALVVLCATLFAWRSAPGTDGRRAAVLLWGSWLVVTGAVFSFAQGIIHPYYNIVLAPAIGALVGIGAVWAWSHRSELFVRLAGAAALGVTSVWSFLLLDRTPTWLPWLRVVVVSGGLLATIVFLFADRLPRRRLATVSLLAAAVLAAFAAPAAYSIRTASTPHAGALPTAGPAGSSRGGFGGPRRFGFRGGPPPGGGFSAPATGFGGGPPRGFGRRGGLGGLLDSSAPTAPLVALLKQDASRYRWVAATVGANSGAGVQLATGDPVLAIGGFNGTDPAPTLARFEQLVAQREIHYFLGGGAGGFGRTGASSSIESWVASHSTAKTVGGVAVYDLTSPHG